MNALKKVSKICMAIFLILACIDIWTIQSVLVPNLKKSYALAATSTGTGLKGAYYDNMDMTSLKVTRTDANVNFNWGIGAPDSSIGADTFSVRWTGLI